MLTATRARGHGPLCQNAAASMALRRAQSLMSVIRPVCSATSKKSAGAIDVAVRLPPAQQRLDRVRLQRFEADFRLIQQLELAPLHRATQRLLDLEARRRGFEQLRHEQAPAVAAQLLRAEQRGIRRAQQRVRIARVIRDRCWRRR